MTRAGSRRLAALLAIVAALLSGSADLVVVPMMHLFAPAHDHELVLSNDGGTLHWMLRHAGHANDSPDANAVTASDAGHRDHHWVESSTPTLNRATRSIPILVVATIGSVALAPRGPARAPDPADRPPRDVGKPSMASLSTLRI